MIGLPGPQWLARAHLKAAPLGVASARRMAIGSICGLPLWQPGDKHFRLAVRLPRKWDRMVKRVEATATGMTIREVGRQRIP